MKKLKWLLLSLCLLLGMTGCGNSDVSTVVDEVLQSGVLEEVLQSGVLDELLQKEDAQAVQVPE
ncbi:MAG: hypothetical protein IKZ01_05550, partial [Anaerotignum sp.]|nr:hypothetical protein [Anaerotignum sp.]